MIGYEVNGLAALSIYQFVGLKLVARLVEHVQQVTILVIDAAEVPAQPGRFTNLPRKQCIIDRLFSRAKHHHSEAAYLKATRNQ